MIWRHSRFYFVSVFGPGPFAIFCMPRNATEVAMKASHREEIELPWVRESVFTKKLYQDGSINGRQRFFKYDLWHCWHLGAGKHWCGCGLLLMSQVVPGNNADLRFAYISQKYQEFCRRQKLTSFITRIDQHTCSATGGEGSWNKAAVTSNMSLFLEDLCEQHAELVAGNRRLEYLEALMHFGRCIVLCYMHALCFSLVDKPIIYRLYFFPLDISRKCIYRDVHARSKAFGCKKMNDVMRKIYAGDVWLRRAYATPIAHGLLQFVRVYLLQAYWAYEAGQSMFSCIPKIHAIHEIWAELERQIAISEWILNPACETCSLDEDFVGRAAVLTRRVSPRAISHRALRRYLAQVNILWGRA